MKPQDALSVWTMAYRASRAIHADAVLSRLKAKESELTMPRAP